MNLRLWSFLLLSVTLAAARDPLALNPENPHYFLWRGKPAVLITSGEHYGAVLNLDFAYMTYLDTLKADGLNLTRTFSGAYVEPHGAFNIASNTLAPGAGRFICPWARSEDRKSTRLNSSHTVISYAVFCLKKKTFEMVAVGALRLSPLLR